MNIIQKIFKSKKPLKIELSKVGVIVSTEASIEAGINNKFNKKIVIYEKASVDGDTVKWGKIIEEIPYTEEEVINLMKIKQIPIVEKKLKEDFKFKEGVPFGEFIQ